MSQGLPKNVRDRMIQHISSAADSLNWSQLSDQQRASWYENWAKDKEIGGVLAHYMDARKVRVYIKDSLLKPYMSQRLEKRAEHVLDMAGIVFDARIKVRSFRKPQGLQLTDGTIICWGNARDWKTIIFAAFERSWGSLLVKKSVVVLLGSSVVDEVTKRMAEEAATRLKVDKPIWSD